MALTTRRRFLAGTAAGAGIALASGKAPFVNRAWAQAKDTVVFASGEPITGSFDPTSHTTLAHINLEGFIFGKLFRSPMRPEDPD